MKSLIDFWNHAPLDQNPLVHPEDAKYLNEKYIHEPILGHVEYAKALAEGKLNSKQLQLTLLPQPFFGDLANARVVILLLNPGLHAADFQLLEKHPDFQEHLFGVIRQTTKANPYLDPRWAWTSGFSWWEGKLRDVAKIIADRKFAGRYGSALELLSRELVSLELVPYHSSSFGAPNNLPSAIAARNTAHRLAEDQERTLIVTRRVRDWGLPQQANIVSYDPGQARGASLSANSTGGQASLRAFGVL